MKTKFWSIYLLVASLLAGVVYFSTAGMSNVPLALSDTQMEQLSGSLVDWVCKEFEPCGAVLCNNNNNLSVTPYTGCYSCETQPNNTCYYDEPPTYCFTCATRVWQYVNCGGSYDSYYEQYRNCV